MNPAAAHASSLPRVILKERKARPFWFGHPWVFSGAVDRVKGRPQSGDVVEVCDHSGKAIGQGFFNTTSQIRVRVVARTYEGPLNARLLLQRLDDAVDLRRSTLRLGDRTNAYRLVHAEGDGLPGLVVDLIDRWLVIQLSSLGMVPYFDALVDRLEERIQPAGILERPVAAAEEEGLQREGGVWRGAAPEVPVEVREDGVRYLCDLSGGQKTGFYIDQRDNRVALAPLAQGRTVLDCFSYVGGFGLRMAQAGARAVHLVDSSEPAMELARAGATLNGVEDRVSFEQGNVLRVLDHLRQEQRRFDLVVLDPPKFVHKRGALDRGLRLYGEVNQKALRVLEPGGILVTCSCSQHVQEAHFDEMLGTAAKEARVRLQELHRGGQGPDHPILHPLEESRYLKCRAFRVWS